MKIFTSTVVMLFCVASVWAQLPKVRYTDTLVYNARLTPDAAVTNAWNWFDNHTKHPVDAQEAKMRNEQGIFKGIGAFQYVSKVVSGNEYSKGTIFYVVALRIHEGDKQYSYEITNFTHQARVSLNALTTADKYPYRVEGDKMWHNMVWKDMKQQVDQHAKELVESLNAAMLAPSVVTQAKKGPVVIVVNN